MTYLRHIKAESLPFPVLSIAVDDTRAVLRILVEKGYYGGRFAGECMTVGDVEDLKTTRQLATPFLQKRGSYYSVGGRDFLILAEGILDKTSSVYSRDWVPGAHWSFHFIPERGFSIDVRPELSFFSKRNTADYVKYVGGMWLFDLWVIDHTAPVTECNRSITTASDTVVITNLEDLGEEWAAADVMKGGVSKWLNLGYELAPSSETVEPDGWIEYTLKILDGKTRELNPAITWNGWIADPVDGYCPHRRISVVNGIGKFRMQALGLQPGEEMRVKVGHRFFSGRVEHTVLVVEAA